MVTQPAAIGLADLVSLVTDGCVRRAVRRRLDHLALPSDSIGGVGESMWIGLACLTIGLGLER